jgi:hypothetical protein
MIENQIKARYLGGEVMAGETSEKAAAKWRVNRNQ